MRFFNFDFFIFFFDFSRFWLDFGRPWALQKLKKIRKNQFFFAFRFEGGFWKASGKVLGGFQERFGRILERLCVDFMNLCWGGTPALPRNLRRPRGASQFFGLLDPSTNQLTDQSVDLSTSRSIDQPIVINESVDWAIGRSIDRSIERPIDGYWPIAWSLDRSIDFLKLLLQIPNAQVQVLKKGFASRNA